MLLLCFVLGSAQSDRRLLTTFQSQEKWALHHATQGAGPLSGRHLCAGPTDLASDCQPRQQERV